MTNRTQQSLPRQKNMMMAALNKAGYTFIQARNRSGYQVFHEEKNLLGTYWDWNTVVAKYLALMAQQKHDRERRKAKKT